MINRRMLLGAVAATLAGAMLGVPQAKADGELHVLNWQGYGTDEAWAMAVEPSGRLLVGGYAMHEGATHHDFALLRLHGDPDRLFWYDHELPPQ